MGSFYRDYGALWVGWPGLILEGKKKAVESCLISEFNCYPVFTPERLTMRRSLGLDYNLGQIIVGHRENLSVSELTRYVTEGVLP